MAVDIKKSTVEWLGINLSSDLVFRSRRLVSGQGPESYALRKLELVFSKVSEFYHDVSEDNTALCPPKMYSPPAFLYSQLNETVFDVIAEDNECQRAVSEFRSI